MRLRRQDSRPSAAVVDRHEGLHTVRGSGHVRHGRARHVLHREVRPRAVEQHHHFAVVGRGRAQSWSPTLLSGLCFWWESTELNRG